MIESRRGVWLGAICALLLAGGASPAGALSFFLPDGNKITNLAFETFGTNTYDGTDPESFDISMRLVQFELNGGPGTFSDFPVDVILDVNVTLQGDLVQGSCGGFPTVCSYSGTYAGGFELFDNGGADLLLTGDFADATLQFSTSTFLGQTTVTPPVILSGAYTLNPDSPSSILFNALGPVGQQLVLAIATSGIDLDGDGMGLEDASGFNVTGAMIPADPAAIVNPEPGTGLLLGAGLVALSAARRRRRSAA